MLQVSRAFLYAARWTGASVSMSSFSPDDTSISTSSCGLDVCRLDATRDRVVGSCDCVNVVGAGRLSVSVDGAIDRCSSDGVSVTGNPSGVSKIWPCPTLTFGRTGIGDTKTGVASSGAGYGRSGRWGGRVVLGDIGSCDCTLALVSWSSLRALPETHISTLVSGTSSVSCVFENIPS